MNIEKLRKQLEIDEGVKYEVYKDHLGYDTFGIGHLITTHDPENGWSVGTEVDEDRVIDAFKQDCESVLRDCSILYEDFYDLPEEAQQVIANMMFNMGRPRLSKFKKMNAAVAEQNWEEAAVQMADSKWHNVDVPTRAGRLVKRMAAMST